MSLVDCALFLGSLAFLVAMYVHVAREDRGREGRSCCAYHEELALGRRIGTGGGY